MDRDPNYSNIYLLLLSTADQNGYGPSMKTLTIYKSNMRHAGFFTCKRKQKILRMKHVALYKVYHNKYM